MLLLVFTRGVNHGQKQKRRAPRYRLSLDGVSFLLPVGAEVTVTRADFSPRVIRRKDDSFASTLRRKLLWGVR